MPELKLIKEKGACPRQELQLVPGRRLDDAASPVCRALALASMMRGFGMLRKSSRPCFSTGRTDYHEGVRAPEGEIPVNVLASEFDPLKACAKKVAIYEIMDWDVIHSYHSFHSPFYFTRRTVIVSVIISVVSGHIS